MDNTTLTNGIGRTSRKGDKMKTLTERQIKNREAKKQKEIEALKNQREIQELTITVEWKKSNTWGMNPHASVNVVYKAGQERYTRDEGFKASGCGYDKESTVIAEIFNKYLRYKLFKLDLTKAYHGSLDNRATQTLPYGIANYPNCTPHYAGGVGTSCYYDISKAIGGTFENVANGKNFGVFKYTDNQGG